ncbi:bacterial proteasome activator family protein [Rhodococcus sp. X156]|uniref:bacterial proteasome activator family protein n=1 Tax=Rhodococcus sp. X156 TaxID=2499145 RepID=UPI000FDC996F|nr:bacterial proteasome activator family protein [Rhodococcus sp. X156]
MTQPHQFHVVGPGTDRPAPAKGTKAPEGGSPPSEMLQQPAKVMRIGTMVKQLLEEVRGAPLDEASRSRLRDIYAASVKELEPSLSPELREELDRLATPFSSEQAPSDGELRVAQAQLVGWLEGVFHGIQAAVFAQQMASRAQLEQLQRGALPPGMTSEPPAGASTGQYL